MIDLLWTAWMRYWSALCAEYERRAIIGYRESLDYATQTAYPQAVARAAEWNLRWSKLRTKATFPAPSEKRLLLNALMRRS